FPGAKARLRRPHRGVDAQRAPPSVDGRAIAGAPASPRVLRCSSCGDAPAGSLVRTTESGANSVSPAVLLDVAPALRRRRSRSAREYGGVPQRQTLVGVVAVGP